MKFDSEKHIGSGSTILGINLFISAIALIGMREGRYWVLLLILAVTALAFWLYFGTYYELFKEKRLIFRSGPLVER